MVKLKLCKSFSRKFFFKASGLALIFAITMFSCNDESPIAEDNETNDYLLEEYAFFDPSDTLNITACEAEDIATAFMDEFASADNTQKSSGISYSARETIVVPDDNNEPSVYVINLEPEGFCIVSSTKKTQSILAYSDRGKFDLDKMPTGPSAWLFEKVDEIQSIRNDTSITVFEKSLFSDKHSVRKKANNADHEEICISTIEQFGPLLNTRWDQFFPYNYYVPLKCTGKAYIYNGKAPAGCVATALCQVLKYHAYPKNKYKWESMSDIYHFNTTVTTNTNIVATLFKDVNNWLGTDFSCDEGSDATVADIPTILKNKFGYADGGKCEALSNYDAERELEKNIKKNSPVIIAACSERYKEKRFLKKAKYSYGNCHTFVCDGFKQNLTKMIGGDWSEDGEYIVIKFFHINWGYHFYEDYDGWYIMSYLNPKKEGGDDEDFQYARQYVYGIKAK